MVISSDWDFHKLRAQFWGAPVDSMLPPFFFALRSGGGWRQPLQQLTDWRNAAWGVRGRSWGGRSISVRGLGFRVPITHVVTRVILAANLLAKSPWRDGKG